MDRSDDRNTNEELVNDTNQSSRLQQLMLQTLKNLHSRESEAYREFFQDYPLLLLAMIRLENCLRFRPLNTLNLMGPPLQAKTYEKILSFRDMATESLRQLQIILYPDRTGAMTAPLRDLRSFLLELFKNPRLLWNIPRRKLDRNPN